MCWSSNVSLCLVDVGFIWMLIGYLTFCFENMKINAQVSSILTFVIKCCFFRSVRFSVMEISMADKILFFTLLSLIILSSYGVVIDRQKY